MNMTQFIKNNKDLKDLPFLIVFRTMQVLRDSGMLRLSKDKPNVDRVQS